MKKRILKIFLIISFIPIVFLILDSMRHFIFGFEVVMMLGLDIPLCYGFTAVINYLWAMLSPICLGIITLPLLLICLVYQIVYFKKESKKVL